MKNKIKFIHLCIVILIVLIALFIRLYKLGSVPQSLHNDEVANTYVGRFVIENKKDIYGNVFPLLYIDKFGDYPPAIPMYFSALGTYIFGINEFGSRFFIALIGTLLIIPFFLTCQLLFSNFAISAILSFLLAVLPWHVILSRANAEGVVALTIYAWGLYFLLKSHLVTKAEQFKIIFLNTLISTLFLLITYILYPSYRIFVPLTLVVFAISALIKRQRKKIIILYGIMFVIFSLLTFYIGRTSWGQGRFKQTSIFNEVSGVQILIDQLNFNEPNIITARIFNNKLMAYSRMFIQQYLSYFSPEFLFIEGGYSKAYSVPYSGLIYLSFILFFIVGLIEVMKSAPKVNTSLILLIAGLLLLSPIAAALTFIETPNTHRSLTMSIFILFFLGPFIGVILKRKQKKIFILLNLIIILEAIFFLHNYLQHASLAESLYRSDGNKEVMMYVIENRNKYDKVLVTNEEAWLPANYLLFSNNFNSELIGKFKKDFRINNIDNVIFTDEKCPNVNLEEQIMSKNEKKNKILFILPESCPTNKHLIKELLSIKRVNSTTAFKIYKTL